MRVAADNGHTGFGETKLGSDNVDDALLGRLDIEEFDAEVGAIFSQRFDLLVGNLIDDVETVCDAAGGDVVIYRGDGSVGAAQLATSHAETVEGLRAGDLVDQMQIDVENARLACGFNDKMLLPYLFEECLGRI
jgi:hypothetical protein